MEEKKQKLILALKDEKARLKIYGVKVHDAAIEFLETGKTTENPENNELLNAVMNDFNSICLDYGIK